MEIRSTSASTQSSVPVTFGQPFRSGDWQHATQGLVAKVDEVAVPVQADEISSHRDGSARFAVISAQLNNLQPGQTKIVNLFAGPKTGSTPNVPADPNWNLEIEAQLYNADGSAGALLVAQPQAQLKAQIASASGRRLAGAVASEYTVVTKLKNQNTGTEHPHLTARLHTRLVDGGQRIRTDVVMENTRTFTAGPGNLTYSLNIKRNGAVLHSQPKLTHYFQSRWHKVLWTGGESLYRVRHNVPYFMASRATANYDQSLNIPSSVLEQEATSLAAANTKPMGPAFLNTYFGSTGGRPEIGPLPRWSVLFLLTQDDRARASMMAVADAAASVPVHYREEQSDQPISVIAYPSVSLKFGTSSPALPTPSGSTIWTADTAHQGSFAYLPYLVTGDAFYQDEMMFWAAWNIATVDPNYRNKASGLVRWNEVRAQAWALRSIWEAKAALPDNHPMKSYFVQQLDNNLTDYANYYQAGNTSTSPMGAVTSPLSGSGEIAPWQNDFLAIVLSLMAENNEPKAASVLEWISRFTVGRYNAESQGFCTVKAPGYYWSPKDSSGNYINSWSTMFSRNYASFVGQSCSSMSIVAEAYPDCALCYAANSRAMLAAAHNAGISGAGTAFTRWKSLTPKLDPAFPKDPTWAIVPRN